MLEIYNEQVHDLLTKDNKTARKGLKVKEHPEKGFYGILSCNFLINV